MHGLSCSTSCGIFLEQGWWTCVPCIGRRILNHWTAREVLTLFFCLASVISTVYLPACRSLPLCHLIYCWCLVVLLFILVTVFFISVWFFFVFDIFSLLKTSDFSLCSSVLSQVLWAYLWSLPWPLYQIDGISPLLFVLLLGFCLIPLFETYSSVTSSLFLFLCIW